MSQQRSLVSFLLAISVGLGAAVALGESVEGLIRRYPYDPACLWGRLANGKGTVVRCLTEKEAAGIAATPAPAPATPSTTAPAPAETTATDSAPASATETATTKGIQVTVGPVTADKGELGIGKLGAPKDRYAKCIEDHGGLKGTTGEVHVRFLVRSRGVAEGVSVVKRSQSVTSEAGACIAEVVDRRRVGVPEEPIVGATVVIKFSAP